tara:strand:- start:60 stop:446 length:387 start_codon:yes stop_codon:yes gene_type:complete
MRIIAILSLIFFSISSIAQNEIDYNIKVCVARKCSSGELLRKDIYRSTGVMLLDADRNKLEAIDFEIIVKIKGQETSYNNRGCNFTDDCKKYIAQLGVGDSFQVRSVTYKLPGGVVGQAEDRNYRIVD